MTSFNGENYPYMPSYYSPHKMEYFDAPIYQHHAPTFTYEPVLPMLAHPIVPSHVDMYSPSSSLSPPQAPIIPSTPGLTTPPSVFLPSSPLPPLPTTTASSCSSQSSSLLPSPVMSSSASPSSCSSLTEKINQRLARANPLPDSFLPEFHQYSKETYEHGSNQNNKKRRRRSCKQRRDSLSSSSTNNNTNGTEDEEEEEEEEVSSAELRRQVHIQSEQKRRAQIRDGFDVLRQQLPGLGHKKMSKATLLHKTVQHLLYMKKHQDSLLIELEKLVQENEHLKRQQQQGLLI